MALSLTGWWQIVNIDKQSTVRNTGTLEAFRKYRIQDIIPLLTIPLPPDPFPREPDRIARSHQSVVPNLGIKHALGHLGYPPELLYLIYDNIDILQDAISLALTNQSLCTIGVKRIHELICATAAPWAGDRLICFDDTVLNRRLPEGLLTDADLKQLYSDISSPHGQSLSDLSWLSWKTVEPNRDMPDGDPSFLRSLSAPELREYRRLVKPNYETSEPHAGPWVLCNLSKREYVCLTASAADAGNSSGPATAGLYGLPEVLLARICWLSETSWARWTPRDERLHRGAWAGSRFVITTLDRMVPPVASGGWTEVSEEVVVEAREIYTDTGKRQQQRMNFWGYNVH